MERYSPEWWLHRLMDDLATRQQETRVYSDYYAGTYPAPVVPARYTAAYKNLIDLARNPWSRLIIDTISERLCIVGVKTGAGDLADTSLWDGFRDSYIDADQRGVHAEALVSGVSYVSVWPSGDGGARISPESPTEVMHASAPGNYREVVAAVKVFYDDVADMWRAELYLPEAVYSFAAPGVDPAGRPLAVSPGDLEPVSEAPNPFGVVPVVPFYNRARMGYGTFSELSDLIPVLRRIDKVTLDMLAAADAAGFRQRWATGLEIPRNPDTGEPIEPFEAAVSKLWISESSDTSFGTFEATDLGPYMKVINDSVAALAAISRVPAHYLMTDLVNPPSADSLVASEAGLVAKVRERQQVFGQSWEQVARLWVKIAGKDVPPGSKPEMVWSSPEFRSPALVADALTKLSTIGVPNEALWQMYGATPDEIRQWRAQRSTDVFQNAMQAASNVPEQADTGPADNEQ